MAVSAWIADTDIFCFPLACEHFMFISISATISTSAVLNQVYYPSSGINIHTLSLLLLFWFLMYILTFCEFINREHTDHCNSHKYPEDKSK